MGMVEAQNYEMKLKIISYNAARTVSLARSLFVGFLQCRNVATFICSRVANEKLIER
jgi:hypothetical protein